jgi:hypothetical protein
MSIYLGTAEIDSLKLGTADVSRVMLGTAEVWSAVDPDAADYFARIVAAGSSISVDNKAAVDAFVRGCKTDGIWTAIKASCLLAGPDNLTGALVPLVGAAPTNTAFVSGDYSRTTGLKGNGSTKFLDANRAANVDASSNFAMATWVHTAPTTGSSYCGSALNTSTSGRRLNYSSTTITGQVASSIVVTIAALSTTGLVGVSRTGTTGNVRCGGANNSGSLTSAATNAGGMQVFRNGLGFTNARLSYYSIGEFLDLALLDARLATYMSALT